MQSGSFVNLSRQRKEQAAARALQEQQAAAAAALTLSNPPPSSLPPTLDIPFNSSSSSYYGSSPSYLAHSTGSGSSSNQSSAGASPLASPPPTQGSTASYHLSPSSAATLGGHAYSPPSSLQDHTYHASANASSNFSLVRRHHTVGSRPQKYLSATQKERLDEEDGDEGASTRTGEGEDDYDDGGSTGAVEGVESSAGSSQGHGGLIVGAAGLGLARAGSLPSKPSGTFSPFPLLCRYRTDHASHLTHAWTVSFRLVHALADVFDLALVDDQATAVARCCATRHDPRCRLSQPDVALA